MQYKIKPIGYQTQPASLRFMSAKFGSYSYESKVKKNCSYENLSKKAANPPYPALQRKWALKAKRKPKILAKDGIKVHY